jgi:hypothetical protein
LDYEATGVNERRSVTHAAHAVLDTHLNKKAKMSSPCLSDTGNKEISHIHDEEGDGE